MPFASSGRAPGCVVASVSLDEFACGLEGRPGVGDAPALFRWSAHPSVHLLRFPDRGAQAAALTRLSLFLEDAQLRGTVAAAAPSGRRAGAAAYSGHNCRLEDCCRFLDAASASGGGGGGTSAASGLSSAEEALRHLLLAARLLLRTPSGGHAAAQPGLSLLAMPRGLGRAEAASTLLHEAMHGLFYASPPFAAAVRRFWAAELSEAQRGAWRSFLSGLGYDAADDELAANELQAYLATERELFGAKDKGRRRGAGLAAEADEALCVMRAAFEASLAHAVPQPLPRLQHADCVCWSAAGPLRLR